MTWIDALARAALYRSCASTILARLDARQKILMYHGVVGSAAGGLERQLRYLKRWFRVVPLQEIVSQLSPSGDVALTFDDGLRNNRTVVLPILKRLGLPATFFVCPGLVEKSRWLWNHEAAARLRRLPEKARVELSALLSSPCQDVSGIVAWMKTLATGVRASCEDAIRNATPDFEPTQAESEANDLMGWDELNSLDPGLVTIGSHGHSHKILTTLTPSEMVQEIEGSRTALESKLKRTIDLFCYPNGDYNQEVAELTRQHYRAAVTTFESVVPSGCDRLLLPRIPAASEMSVFALRMCRPQS